ncbi:MAG: hypothetical protein ACFC1C_02245 [Candidatus Malihini olakiniferum]
MIPKGIQLKGIQLARQCPSQLQQAEKYVQILISDEPDDAARPPSFLAW